jgi:hypothetical protein
MRSPPAPPRSQQAEQLKITAEPGASALTFASVKKVSL